MAIKTLGYKPTAAFDSIKHSENYFTLKKCGYGQKYISVFILQNLNLRSVTDSYVSEIVYSKFELFFVHGHNCSGFSATSQKGRHLPFEMKFSQVSFIVYIFICRD